MYSHHMEHKDKNDVIHKYYMDVINSFSEAIYWIDVDCNLIGCNQAFINLIGIKNPHELKNTPYALMHEYAHWPQDRIEAFKLDDMRIMFTGSSVQNIEEKVVHDAKNKSFYFKANRIPLYDEHKQIIGLTVTLNDISELIQLRKEQKEYKKTASTTLSNTPIPANKIPKVLMIEDNIIAQNVEKSLLMSLNCIVDVADTGDKAIELFAPGKYDLVLMDIGLVETSGYVVAKQLRKKEQQSAFHVPIIALTGYEAEKIKYDCEQYFMEGALTKPLTKEQAEQIIQHYVYNQEVEIKGFTSI